MLDILDEECCPMLVSCTIPAGQQSWIDLLLFQRGLNLSSDGAVLLQHM